MPDIRIALPDALHARLKASAAVSHKTLKTLVIEIVKAYIDQRKGVTL